MSEGANILKPPSHNIIHDVAILRWDKGWQRIRLMSVIFWRPGIHHHRILSSVLALCAILSHKRSAAASIFWDFEHLCQYIFCLLNVYDCFLIEWLVCSLIVEWGVILDEWWVMNDIHSEITQRRCRSAPTSLGGSNPICINIIINKTWPYSLLLSTKCHQWPNVTENL